MICSQYELNQQIDKNITVEIIQLLSKPYLLLICQII